MPFYSSSDTKAHDLKTLQADPGMTTNDLVYRALLHKNAKQVICDFPQFVHQLQILLANYATEKLPKEEKHFNADDKVLDKLHDHIGSALKAIPQLYKKVINGTTLGPSNTAKFLPLKDLADITITGMKSFGYVKLLLQAATVLAMNIQSPFFDSPFLDKKVPSILSFLIEGSVPKHIKEKKVIDILKLASTEMLKSLSTIMDNYINSEYDKQVEIILRADAEILENVNVAYNVKAQ